MIYVEVNDFNVTRVEVKDINVIYVEVNDFNVTRVEVKDINVIYVMRLMISM